MQLSIFVTINQNFCMQKVKNIILDYGNVIFMIDFMRAQEAFTALGIKNVDQFFAHKGHAPLFDAFEKGEITAEAFRQGIRDAADVPYLSDEQIDAAWNALLIGVPEGNHELLLELKGKYRLFLLSNNNEIHYQWIMDYLKREYQLEDNTSFFEKDYYSHLMKMRKPNADIFEYVLNTHDLKPEETVFIDDSPQHLDTAAKLGLHTFLLTKPDTLSALLKREKLID
ncbi:HAD family hydrolase [Sphingobacterium spiritivorum]|uniref:HAD hydrolase, family IA, variant 3 n=1 Tax=Sphingobacterium spiritivorum ATCC 33861 TaxID=525373 RepID=D7VS45_SPHSI|nr:HAD family phosphatase [Sphingobacterium spiritivorum]EFK56596.1 HAD hydrolase, family IA, variant 3 [Sphingobacterium spiritivorum ATCC 33861]QQT35352.1 HAD family phosphatase [Sphingobacterium spiritivorum]WQD32035.1 HAD family phosphatase [Sphingobacterium spiritivorum]